MRSSMTASATVTLEASLRSIVAGSVPMWTLRTTIFWPGASVGMAVFDIYGSSCWASAPGSAGAAPSREQT